MTNGNANYPIGVSKVSMVSMLGSYFSSPVVLLKLKHKKIEVFI